jgi:hypothetical protein
VYVPRLFVPNVVVLFVRCCRSRDSCLASYFPPIKRRLSFARDPYKHKKNPEVVSPLRISRVPTHMAIMTLPLNIPPTPSPPPSDDSSKIFNSDSVPPTPISPTISGQQQKRKPSRRANTAERRATHNAVERQRRETLNGRFLASFISPFLLLHSNNTPHRISQLSFQTFPKSVVPLNLPSSTPPSLTSTLPVVIVFSPPANFVS